MSNERKVLASAIQKKEAFDAIEGLVADGDLTEQAKVVWQGLKEYYTRDQEAKACDPEILCNTIARALKTDKHRETFGHLVQELAAIEVSPANVVHDFLAVKQEAVGAKLATALISGGKDVDALIEEYQKWSDGGSLDQKDERLVLQGPTLTEITSAYSGENLIRVWPTSLNDKLDGGLLRGHHMVVFARPEMGKTMFLVNAVAGFLSQGLTALYIGNEDPISDIVLRVVSRLTKLTKFEVLSDVVAAENDAREKGYDNLILAGLAPGTPREIEELVEEFQPDVLLIDQLRNLNVGGNKDGNYTQQLEKAATAARNIGKRNDVLVVSVTQAGDSASGKAVLDMGDVDSSNTGIPAQADVMVGIGATTEDLQMGRRVLSMPKNKRSGRHDFFPVRIDPALNRIINVGG